MPTFAEQCHADRSLCCDRMAGEEVLEAKLLDLEQAGRAGVARYKYFLNGKVQWPLQQPDGQLITQEHDKARLRTTISECKGKGSLQASTAAQANISHWRKCTRQGNPPLQLTHHCFAKSSLHMPRTMRICSAHADLFCRTVTSISILLTVSKLTSAQQCIRQFGHPVISTMLICRSVPPLWRPAIFRYHTSVSAVHVRQSLRHGASGICT